MLTNTYHHSPAIEPLIDGWLAEKQSDSTRRNYARALSAWRNFLAGHSLRAVNGSRRLDLWDANTDLVRAWQQSMRDSELRVATINHALSSVSSFYAYAIATHSAPAHLVRNPIGVDVRREAVDAFQGVQPLSIANYDLLLAHLEDHSNTLSGARAHALLRTFLHTGWRVAPLLQMTWGAIRPSRSRHGAFIYTRSTSGGAAIDDILPSDCHEAICHYLRLANRAPETLAPDAYLWTPIREPNISGFGALLDPARPICARTALRILRTWLHAAGIAHAERYRLIDLRHTHALLLLESGASLPAIQERLQHTRPQTTTRYLRRTFAVQPADDHTQGFAALRTSR